MMADELAPELAYYTQHKEELLRHHAGAFVVVRGSELLGAFTTESEAYEAALKKYGNTPVLIRQVLRDEPRIQFPALVVGAIRGSNP
jgi:hypothetical protein